MVLCCYGGVVVYHNVSFLPACFTYVVSYQPLADWPVGRLKLILRYK